MDVQPQNLQQVVDILAPVLPYLLQGAKELAKSAIGELGKKLTAQAWESLEQFAGKIRKKAEAKPAARDALQRAADAPDDPRVRGMVSLYLEEILRENPDLLAEAVSMLEDSGMIISEVKVKDVKKGGKVTGVKVENSGGGISIQSKVKADDVEGEVTGVDYEG